MAMEQLPKHVREFDKIGQLICLYVSRWTPADELPEVLIVRQTDALYTALDMPGDYMAHVSLESIEYLTGRSYEPNSN